jgi:hypothetical protein
MIMPLFKPQRRKGAKAASPQLLPPEAALGFSLRLCAFAVNRPKNGTSR